MTSNELYRNYTLFEDLYSAKCTAVHYRQGAHLHPGVGRAGVIDRCRRHGALLCKEIISIVFSYNCQVVLLFAILAKSQFFVDGKL